MSKKKLAGSIISIMVIAVLIVGSYFFILPNRRNDCLYYQSIIQEEWNKSLSEDAPDFIKKLDSLSSFCVSKVKKIDSGFHVVTLLVTSPNISESLEKYQKEVEGKTLSTDKMNSEIVSLIEKAQPKTTKQSIYVIEDEAGNCYVRFSEEFLDAMSGYAYTTARNSLSKDSTFIAGEG